MNKLIRDILKNGKTLTWLEYAKKYKIRPDSSDYIRSKAANDKWRAYLRKEKRNMVLKKKTIKNKKGNWKTYVNDPFPVEQDVTDLKLSKVWITPEGRVGKSYSNSFMYGIEEKQFQELIASVGALSLHKSTSNNFSGNSKKGTIYLADLHIGAFIKALDEVVHTQEFNSSILSDYLNNVVSIVNAHNYEEVHLFIPGDVVESFSAFNHRDTWKHIQYYQGEIITASFSILKHVLSSINNLHTIYMVEGNHDRMTAAYEGNSRKGMVEVLAFFLKESGFPIKYHPLLIGEEIDGIYHIMTHGDLKNTTDYDKFLFKNGKQGIFNLVMTGHFHQFGIIKYDKAFIHVSCPSIFTGNFYSEAMNVNGIPAFLIIENNGKGKPKINYIPL